MNERFIFAEECDELYDLIETSPNISFKFNLDRVITQILFQSIYQMLE